MTLLIQRVLKASVTTEDQTASIDQGLCVYVSFQPSDTPEVLLKMAQKLSKLRIFDDANGKMNLSIQDISGALLCVPNFTLEAEALKSNRPSFSKAKPFHEAEDDFHLFCDLCAKEMPTQRGFFGENMTVTSDNDGPVNIIIRSDHGLSN